MLAIQYILGQLNAPLGHLVTTLQESQEARLSLERLGEVYAEPEEGAGSPLEGYEGVGTGGLRFVDVSFGYATSEGRLALDAVNLEIPEGKVTAIVGTSGSGKTTMLKLLLKFYEPQKGEIRVGALKLGDWPHVAWRERCGVVLQDGYIFAETLQENIALGTQEPDLDRLTAALRVACLEDFVQSLPLGLKTKIGKDGFGMSHGQRQRVLIARAVYNEPAYLFFDEATSALDAETEDMVVRRLEALFTGRTVVVVAHRLSTVRHADRIAVLQGGRVVEVGTHEDLSRGRGAYYKLVRQQLEVPV
jgi:ATP-binding cassette subfamily B protein